MIAELLLFALCGAAALPQESVYESLYESFSDSEALKNLMDEGRRSVLETTANVKNAPLELKNSTEERFGCLLWEHQLQRIATNKTISEAVCKGMQKNRWFINYQCILQNSQETFQKLDDVKSKIPNESNNILEKGLSGIRPVGLLMPGLYDYVQDFHRIKQEELNKANSDGDRQKILKEAEEKIKYLKSILKQVNELVTQLRFKALEEHINFSFQTENNLKKIQREGAQKILKCVG